MGCLSSRNISDSKYQAELNSKLLQQLQEGGYFETIILITKIYNYCYIKERKQWILRKRKIVLSIDQLTKSQQLESRNYFKSFLDQYPESQILLRPLNSVKPSTGDIKIHTRIQKNDQFPHQVYVKFVDSKGYQLMNFGNNGKYTFFLQLKLYNYSSLKQFYKFQQILQIKISKILKFGQLEFFGLIDWQATDKIADLNRFLNKYNWNMKFIDISNANEKHNIYFNGNQIFHILDDENRIDADIFVVIDSFGKVIRAEVADFYQSKKQQEQLLQCDEFDDISSQKSKAIKYEKRLLKELHLHYSSYITKNKQQQKQVSFSLNKNQLIQQQILQSLETISEVQYKDFKQLFISYRLQQILMRYHPGEPFQFELTKQEYYNYDHNEKRFLSNNKLYLLPSIYPSASIEKQKILSEVCRQLKESIGLRWKDPDLNIYSIPHRYTFNKTDLMDFLMEFTQEFHLKLFFKKKRIIKLIQKSKTESKILKWEQEIQPIWSTDLDPCFIFSNSYELNNKSIVISNLEELKKIKQQQEQHQNQFKKLKIQNLCPNAMQLIRQFINKGINYQIQIGQKIIHFDEEFQINENCLLFVIYQNNESYIQAIINKLSKLSLSEQLEIKFLTTTKCNQINTKSQKINYYVFNQEWDHNFGLSFQVDVVEKYFNVDQDFKAFYFNGQGILENILLSQQFFEALDTETIVNNNLQQEIENQLDKKNSIKCNIANQWKTIKTECFNLNSNLNEIINSYDFSNVQLQITSEKFLFWDSHNYIFQQSQSNIKLEQNLNLQQIAVLNNYVPSMIQLIDQ